MRQGTQELTSIRLVYRNCWDLAVTFVSFAHPPSTESHKRLRLPSVMSRIRREEVYDDDKR